MRIMRFERKRPRHEAERPPMWLMGTTDLVTLLLAFFILLFATSALKNTDWNKVSQSVRSRFGDEHRITEIQGEPGHVDAEKTWTSEESNPGLNLDYLYSVVKKYVASDPSLEKVTVWKDHDVVVLSFGADLSFAPGDTAISPAGRNLLNILAAYLSTLPNTLEVVGYADPMPLQSDKKYNSNWHLSLLRANSVADALRTGGYEADIMVRGKGVSMKTALPDDFSENDKNRLARRVDLRLYLLQP